jgi:hypothetical protein
MQPNDIDSYLSWGHQQGWGRITVGNVVDALRAFLRYGGEQGWCQGSLAKSIRGSRVYALENLPAGPRWSVALRYYRMKGRGDFLAKYRAKHLQAACIM